VPLLNALSSLLLLLSVAAFVRWQRGARSGAPLFVLVGWIYFQCDFGSFFPTMVVLGILAIAASWPRIGAPVGVFAALGAAVAPFGRYYGILELRARNRVFTFEQTFLLNLYNINQFVIGLSILALCGWFVWRSWAELSRERRMLLSASAGIILSMIPWVPAVATVAFYRYVVQLTPLAALVTAWTAVRLVDAVAGRGDRPWLRPAALAAVGAIVAVTGIASAPVAAALSTRDLPFHPVARPELGAAAREIFEERPDPNRLVIDAIAPALRPGDEILVNYEDVPFMFYTTARVRGGVAAFRVEDHEAPPPRFLVIRRSVRSFIGRSSSARRRDTSGAGWRPGRRTCPSATARIRAGCRCPRPRTRSSLPSR